MLEPKSVQDALSRIKDYTASLQRKANEVCARLSVIGKQVVDYQYSLSHEEYEVSCVSNGNSSMIIAEGNNVLFLEFGTGVYTDDFTEDMETKGLPPIFAGSYSQSEGMGHFRPDHQYWYYDGVKYQGTLPMQGFYFASKEIRERAVEEAKRVFRK